MCPTSRRVVSRSSTRRHLADPDRMRAETRTAHLQRVTNGATPAHLIRRPVIVLLRTGMATGATIDAGISGVQRFFTTQGGRECRQERSSHCPVWQ